MSAQYAFLFDAQFCSGCKACQAACKDKNHLPPGVLWRRILEVTGGTWQKDGQSWKNTVIAYNLSISCNQCLHPKCAGICPVNAFLVREDGIVILDETKCMGCGYCAWGCPYGAPQYNPDAGHMSKCDFCFDQIELGLPPACVAACPLRVLNYGNMDGLPPSSRNEIRLWEAPSVTHPHPLPAYSHTQPRLAIKQHPAMGTSEEKYLANLEEVQPRGPSAWDDVPLMLFTLLCQMAVGGVWAMAWMFPTLWARASTDALSLKIQSLLLISTCLVAGVIASLAHLGTKKNAWRVFTNLSRSSLSREIFFTLLFASALCISTLATLLHTDISLWIVLAAAAGLGLVHNMAQVYRLPAAPGWNTWRTNAGFMVSGLLLGISMMTTLLAYESAASGIRVSVQQAAISYLLIVLLLIQLVLSRKASMQHQLRQIWIGLIFTGIAIAGATLFQQNVSFTWFSVVLLVIVLAEESLGRWLFYRSRM